MDSVLNIQVVVRAQNLDAQVAAINKRLSSIGRGLGSGSITNTSAIDQAIAKVSSAISTVEKFGQRLQTAGRQLTNTFTLPIVIAGAAATHFALQNETAGAQLQRVYQGPIKDITLLRQGFEALSSLYGIQQSDIINIGTAWAKAGAQGSALLKLTDLTAQAMLLSGQSASDAASAVIALRQQWGLTADGLHKAIAELNLISDTTQVSLADLFDSMTKGAGTARTVGVDLQHYGAMVAALVPASGSAQNAGTVLSRILEKLFTPTKATSDLMKEFGINVLDASYQSLNGAQRLELLAQKFNKLNPAQQALIGTTAASKIQVNGLDTLLRAIVDPLSNYNKVLHETGNQTDALKRMTQDLNTILSSNPQRFQIIKTSLENALADAIIPALPALFELAQMVTQLVKSFTNLSPQTQKQILYWLGLLAVLGPVVRIVGGLIVVLGGVGKALLLPIKALGLLADTFAKVLGSEGIMSILSGSVQALFMGLDAVLGGVIQLIAATVGILVGGFQEALLALEPVFAAAGTAVMGAFETAATAALVAWEDVILPIMGDIGAAAALAFETAFTVAQKVFSAIALPLLVLWEDTIVPAMATIGTAAGVAFITAFEATKETLAALAVAMLIIWDGVIVPAMAPIGAAAAAVFEAAFAGIGITLPAIGAFAAEAFAAALAAGPEIAIGALAAGVIALLAVFSSQINDGIQSVVSALGKLPGYVGNALLGVLRVVVQFGQAIWQALQDYLNPFQRHSPSLVDLVVAGVDVISAKYKSLGNLGTAFRAAVSDIKAFNGAMTDVIAGQRALENAQAIKAIGSQGGSAAGNAAARGLGIEGTLYTDLDRVTAAYGRQEIVVDKLNAKLTASQKILDVEQTKLTNLQAVADGFSSKLNDAQTALDKWSNTPLPGQTKMSNAIFNNGIAIDKLQLKLDKLQDAKGNLDDIHGQLELLTGQRNALRLQGAGSDVLAPFNDQINAITGSGSGLSDAVDQMTKLEQEITNLQKKGDELNLQQSIEFDPLTRQINQAATAMKAMPFDRIIAGVEFEKRKVDALTTSYRFANDRVKDQEVVVKNAQVAHDKLNATYETQNDKLSALGDTYDTIQSMIQAIDQTFKNAASSAGDFNSALADAAGAGNIKVPGLPTSVPSDPEDLQKLVDSYQNGVKKAFGRVKFGDIFTKPFKDSWNEFAGPGGWWQQHVQTKLDILNIHMPSPSFDEFKQNWHSFQDWWDKTAFPWIKSLPGAMVDGFKSLGRNLWEGLIGVGEAIIHPFVWAYDKLLGHSIIPDIVNGIETWFKKLPSKIVHALGNIGRDLFNWGEGLMVQMFGGIGQVWNQYIQPFFARTWDRISGAVAGTGGRFLTWGSNLMNDAWNGIQSVWNNFVSPFFSGLKNTILGALGDTSTWLLDTGKSLFGGLLTGMQNAAKNIPGVGVIEGLPIVGPIVKSVLGFHLAEGGIAQPVPGGIHARIAEAGRPELVAPLPSGFSMSRLVGTMDRMEKFIDKGGNTLVTSGSSKTENHFHGDLVFPNVKNGDDAEAFIRNLESMS